MEDEFGDPVVEYRVAEKIKASVRFVSVRHAGVGERTQPQWLWQSRDEVSYRHNALYSTLVNATTTLWPPKPIEVEIAAFRSGFWAASPKT